MPNAAAASIPSFPPPALAGAALGDVAAEASSAPTAGSGVVDAAWRTFTVGVPFVVPCAAGSGAREMTVSMDGNASSPPSPAPAGVAAGVSIVGGGGGIVGRFIACDSLGGVTTLTERCPEVGVGLSELRTADIERTGVDVSIAIPPRLGVAMRCDRRRRYAWSSSVSGISLTAASSSATNSIASA